MRWIFTSLIAFSFNLTAQTIAFLPIYNGEKLQLEKSYYDSTLQDSIRINKLQFYVSDIILEYKNGDIKAVEKKHHLLDFSKPETFSIQYGGVENKTPSKISFKLGIDSTTNVSGALGGDLDPTMGMYWTWQSGYINFKLEGVTQKVKTRKDKFQFHLGGYSFPNKSVVLVDLEVENVSSVNIRIELALEKIIQNIDFENSACIMSPSKKAVELSKNISKSFLILE